MKHITYVDSPQYPVAVLIKSYILDTAPDKIRRYYVDPLVAEGVPLEDIIVIGLPYDSYKDVKAKTINAEVPNIQAYMDTVGVRQMLMADGKYLKKFSGRQKVTNLAGVLLPSKFGSQTVFKTRVYTTFVFDDKAEERALMGIKAIAESHAGTYAEKDIVVESHLVHTHATIASWLAWLVQQPLLTCDIEGFDLRLDSCGIGTISFGYGLGKAVCFSVDYQVQGEVGKPNKPVRLLLEKFFREYQGTMVYHNVSFDVKHLVANLFMKNDLLDYPAMVEGVELLTRNHRCTKDMAYLATNSAAGNDLSLKHLTLEYTGEFAIDVKDITKHPVDVVMEYNNKDCMATWWLYHKLTPILIERDQNALYYNTFQPNQRMLINMELTGMPLDMDEVIRLRTQMNKAEKDLLARMRTLDAVTDYLEWKAVVAHQKYQNSVKGDGRTLEDYKEWKKDELIFKPTSDPALVWILHDHYCLPIIDKTMKAREPSVAGDTLKKHIDWIKAGNGNPEAAGFIKDVVEYLEIVKINGTFVKAFITKSIRKSDGIYYLHGSFNQGGTVSGRLSSSDP